MRLAWRRVLTCNPIVIAWLVVLVALVVAAAVWPPPAAAQRRSEADSIRVLSRAQSLVRDHMDSQRLRSSRAVRDARARVIDRLDEHALESPGDDWIAGHRVGLRVVQGRLQSALAVARECRASPWWCEALTGFVHHMRGEFEAADRAFDRSMASMAPDRRCEWLDDMRFHLLSGAADREFRAADCAGRLALADRFWWLADPFYLLPGNDRKTEHLARLVGMELHHQYLHFDGRPCSPGHHAAQVLQGWPDYWWETEGPITELGPGPGYSFLPSSAVWEDPLLAGPADWPLSPGGYDERYDPAYGPVYELDSQVAFFARGDDVEVVAASDLADHPLGGSAIRDAALVLGRDERTPPLIGRSETEGDRLIFRVTAPDRRYLVSLEVLSDGAGAARSRSGQGLSAPLMGISVSDMLLWEWRPDVAEELDSIAPRMLGSTRFARSARLGVYWETYGLSEGQAVDVFIQTVPRGRGFFRRLGEALRLVDRRESLRFVWREGADAGTDGIVGRTLELDLSGLAPGEYTIELGVADGSGQSVVTRRDITLREG